MLKWCWWIRVWYNGIQGTRHCWCPLGMYVPLSFIPERPSDFFNVLLYEKIVDFFKTAFRKNVSQKKTQCSLLLQLLTYLYLNQTCYYYLFLMPLLTQGFFSAAFSFLGFYCNKPGFCSIWSLQSPFCRKIH